MYGLDEIKLSSACRNGVSVSCLESGLAKNSLKSAFIASARYPALILCGDYFTSGSTRSASPTADKYFVFIFSKVALSGSAVDWDTSIVWP